MSKKLARLCVGLPLLLAGVARAQTAAPPAEQTSSGQAQTQTPMQEPAAPQSDQPTSPDQQASEQSQPVESQEPAVQMQQLQDQVQSQQDQIQQLKQQLESQTQTVDQLNQANDELGQTNDQLSQANQQLGQLRDQVAQGQANVEAREAARTQSSEQLARVLDNLRTAEYVLSVGSTSGVEDALDDASQFLTGQAADAIYAAQVSLDNEDLFAARRYLVQAIAVGVANQVGGTNQSIATPTP